MTEEDMSVIWKYILFLYAIPAVIMSADLARCVYLAETRKEKCSSRGIARYGLFCFIPVVNLFYAILIVLEFVYESNKKLLFHKRNDNQRRNQPKN